MRYVIAVLFLSVSVFLLIVAKQFYVEVGGGRKLLHNQLKGTLNDEPKNLFWFLQISDIHISKFNDKGRIKDFRRFCTEVQGAVKARVVIASGEQNNSRFFVCHT